MESNLFVLNDLLKRELEICRDKINLLNSTISDYEKKIKELEENELYKKEENKIYHKTYFQEKTKNRFKHCNYCNLDIKNSSYCNHIKSKFHLENVNKQL